MLMKKLYLIIALISLTLLSRAQVYDIYVSDAGNFSNPPWQILKYDENGQNPQVFINSNLAWPQDIVFLEDKNEVLVSNLNTGRITRYNATTGQYINDFATGIAGPTRMEIGPDSLLYVLQWNGNGNVLRYKRDGTAMGQFTIVGVNKSIGIAWDTSGNLYVSSYTEKYIRKYDTAGADLGKFIDTNLVGPTNIWFDVNGDLMVVDYNAGIIKRFNTNGTFISNFIMGLAAPEGIDFLPNGNILLGNGNTSAVKEYTIGGVFVKDIVPSGSGGLMKPNAVVLREVLPLGAAKIYPEKVQLQPTIGSKFYLSAGEVKVEDIQVFDSTGRMVKKGKLQEALIWDASGMAEGIYIIEMRLSDNRKISHKVMVKN